MSPACTKAKDIFVLALNFNDRNKQETSTVALGKPRSSGSEKRIGEVFPE